jgi:hypothetical protein
LPIIGTTIIQKNWLDILSHLSLTELSILVSGGLFFGLGMLSFMKALKYIGIGVPFTFNIAISTVSATALSWIFSSSIKNRSFSFIVLEILAMILFVSAVIFIGKAKSAITTDSDIKKKSDTSKGLILSVVSGVLCGAQGGSYGLVTPHLMQLVNEYHVSPIVATSLPWAIIFPVAFVPCVLFFAREAIKNKELKRVNGSLFSNLALIAFMGLMYYGSILSYSKGILLLGKISNIYAWPLFMSSILLVSISWSFIFSEWKGKDRNVLITLVIGLLLLVLAVFILGSVAELIGK